MKMAMNHAYLADVAAVDVVSNSDGDDTYDDAADEAAADDAGELGCTVASCLPFRTPQPHQT